MCLGSPVVLLHGDARVDATAPVAMQRVPWVVDCVLHVWGEVAGVLEMDGGVRACGS
jgi:hypothetical protein